MVDPKPDYYQVLGVRRTVSQAELKKAYHRLARRYHPDVSQARDAETAFKRISEAYYVLSDKDRRAEYDYVTRYWQQRGRAAYPDQTAFDEFIASHFDAKGDIQRERACLFDCPYCGRAATVFFDHSILSWQNYGKRCDSCARLIVINYEVKKDRIVLFTAEMCQ